MAELTVEHLEVRYGDLVGVADISLKVEAGQVVALLGSNGAGKTTTLNAIAGAGAPGARPHRMARRARFPAQPAYAIVSKGLALSPEGWRLFVGADGRAESAARRHRARRPLAHRCVVRARLCAVSAARRAPPPGRRHAVGRRAADAGARPRADERAASADARRAEPRPRAHGGRDALRHAHRAAPAGSHAACWPSSRSRSRSASPIMPMCCRPGASRSKARRRSSSERAGAGDLFGGSTRATAES